MYSEQKRDLKMAIRILRGVSEGNPDIVIGHCVLFEALNQSCSNCPFRLGPLIGKCQLREAISLLEGVTERGESLYNPVVI